VAGGGLNQITLRPLGELEQGVLEELRRRLEETFGCPVEIKPQNADLAHAYNSSRKQYLSTTLLSNISVLEGEKALGIVDVDLYVPRLNFVFGEADMISGVAIISLFRLRQEHYGLPPNRELFLERAVKEAVHELGHTYGLGHCPDAKCIMHFSNSLMDTDKKQAAFCPKCQQILEKGSKC
jgi:archaemetzincin